MLNNVQLQSMEESMRNRFLKNLLSVIFVLWICAFQIFAYDREDLDHLLRTNECADCDLSQANLIGMNLRGADLSDANLQGANLRGAALMFADLSDANLVGANLSRANLYATNLYDADLYGANLYGARFCNTVMPDGKTAIKGC